MPLHLDTRSILEGALRQVADRRRWLAEPWTFASEVIGREAIEDAAGRSVDRFVEEQKLVLTAFCDTSIAKIILKTGRGGSKTFLFALGIATMAYCIPRFTATILAGSLEQGRILYHYFERFAASARFAECLDGETTKIITRLRGGGWVRVLTASEKQVKGPHPQVLVIDEACAADVDILELAIGQRLGSSLGLLRVSSTPDKIFHIFRDWWTEADEKGWRAFGWGARRWLDRERWEPALPWIHRDLIEDMMLENDTNWVRIHIDGEFGSATGTVFRFEDVELSRIAAIEEDPIYNPEIVVSSRIGVDWGFENPTVLTVSAKVEVPPDLQVQLGLRSKDLYYVLHVEGWVHKSEDFLYGRIADLLRTWPGDLYLDASHTFQNQTVRRLAAQARRAAHPIPFSRDKMAMVSWTRSILEKGQLRIPRRFVETLDQLASYAWEEGGKERPMKVNDDYVDSLMLSLWGHRLGRGGPPGAALIDLGRPG